MPRAMRLGAGLVLALFVVTCTDTSLTGPGRRVPAAFDVSSLVAAQSAGDAPIPLDSFVVILSRLDGTVAVDTAIPVLPDTLHGDSAVVGVSVPMRAPTESLAVSLRAVGAGLVWFEVDDTVTVAAGGITRPAPVTARYVGPGANAAFLFISPADTSIIAGTSVPFVATVYDSLEAVIPGVPVGYRLSDSTAGGFVYPTYATALLVTAPRATTDTLWVVAETPTHVADSTQIVLQPAPAAGPVAHVVIAPKTDTIPVGALAIFSASLFDAQGVPAVAPVTWSSTAPSVAAVDSLGIATALANGTAGIIAAANGHADTATLVVSGAGQALAFFDTGTVTLGVGQVITDEFVTVPAVVAANTLIHFQSSDSAVVAAPHAFAFAPDTATMVQFTNFAGPVAVVGQVAGTASLIATAPGYQTAALPFAIGTPQFITNADGVADTAWVNGQPFPLVVETVDQAGVPRQVAQPLTVSDSVGDTTVLALDSAVKVVDSLGEVTEFAVSGKRPGTSVITLSGANYLSHTVNFAADSMQLTLGGTTGSIGPNQLTDSSFFVSLNWFPAAPVTVTLASSDSTVVSVPASVTIDSSVNFAYVRLAGKALGSATITATAAGVRAAVPLPITVNQPALIVVPLGAGALGAPDTVLVYVVDSLGGLEQTAVPLTVTLATSDPTHVTLASDTATIPAGGTAATFVATPDSAATYTLTATAPGYTPGTSFIFAATAPIGVAAAARPVAVPAPVVPRRVARIAPRAAPARIAPRRPAPRIRR